MVKSIKSKRILGLMILASVFIFPSFSSAAVVVKDSTPIVTFNYGNPLSVTYTVPTGSDFLAVFMFGAAGTNSMTWNGDLMTCQYLQAGDRGSDNFCYIANPDIGTYTLASSLRGQALVVSLSGVDPSGSLITYASATDASNVTSKAVSLSATTAGDFILYAALTSSGTSISCTYSLGTEIWDVDNNSQYGVMCGAGYETSDTSSHSYQIDFAAGHVNIDGVVLKVGSGTTPPAEGGGELASSTVQTDIQTTNVILIILLSLLAILVYHVLSTARLAK